MDNSKEYIVAAAYKVLPGFECTEQLIFKHPILRDEYGIFDDIYRLRIGRHHAEILHMFGAALDPQSDGFYTSWGRYVNRYEAAEIAIKCEQCQEGTLIMGDRLDSSDIFK